MTLFASYSRRESTTVNYELVNPELVPASNAFNHFGQPVLVDYSFYNEIASGLLPAPTEISDSTAVSGGGTFSLALPWGDWRSRLQFGLERDTEYSATQQIANVYNAAYVTQPAGALAAYTAALDSSNPNTALNLFGNGTGSGKDVKFANFLYEAGTGNTVSDLKSATLSFDGTVLTLPTGKVKAAVGAEIRNESLDFTQYILNVFPENPSRNLDAVFGELLVPLLGDENQRGGRDVLQLELAGRYDHYRITGPFGADTGEVDSRGSEILSTETKTFAASSPQIGLRWQPVRDLTLKANWSKAFQAPTIQDLFTPGVSIPQTTYDPYNPASNGGPKTVSFILLGGGNPNLQPQTSTSSTFEVAYKPAQLPGLSAVVDFNHTRVTNVITIGVQSSIAPGYAQYLEYPALNPGVMRNAQGVLQDINFADINAAVQISQSIDLRLFYDFEIDHWGNFSVGTAATDTMKLSEQISPGAPAVNIAGTVAGPSTWHVIPSVLWARGSWGANLYVNFNSAVANDDITSPQRVVGSITTVDTQVYWKLPREGWRFAMGAHNLFNVTPPFYDTPYGVDFSRYNPAARQIYANVTKSFGGGAK
jgi:iron complex outermembrane recepter protein